MVLHVLLNGLPLVSHGLCGVFSLNPEEFLFTFQGVLSVSNQLLAKKKLLLFFNIISQSIVLDLLHQAFTGLLFILIFSIKLTSSSVTILNGISVSSIGRWNILAKFVEWSE